MYIFYILYFKAYYRLNSERMASRLQLKWGSTVIDGNEIKGKILFAYNKWNLEIFITFLYKVKRNMNSSCDFILITYAKHKESNKDAHIIISLLNE